MATADVRLRFFNHPEAHFATFEIEADATHKEGRAFGPVALPVRLLSGKVINLGPAYHQFSREAHPAFDVHAWVYQSTNGVGCLVVNGVLYDATFSGASLNAANDDMALALVPIQ